MEESLRSCVVRVLGFVISEEVTVEGSDVGEFKSVSVKCSVK